MQGHQKLVHLHLREKDFKWLRQTKGLDITTIWQISRIISVIITYNCVLLRNQVLTCRFGMEDGSEYYNTHEF